METAAPSESAKKAIAVIAPDEDIKAQQQNVSIFLAGTIDKGDSRDWQAEVTKVFDHLPITIYNPRRPEGFPWKEDDEETLKEQVDWEHKHLVGSDIITMWFEEKSQSPITLAELGLFATSGKLIVGCPKKYMRYGNVERYCNYYNIPLMHTLDELIEEVGQAITELEKKPRSQRKKITAASPFTSALQNPWTYAIGMIGLAAGFGLGRTRR